MSDPYLTRQTLLMRVLQQGDNAAWEEFVEVYKRFIYHILHRMNIGTNDFEDLVQDVLVRLWQKLSTYQPEKGKFRTWLSTVIRNIVLNDISAKKRRETKHRKLKDGDEEYSFLEKATQPEIDKMIEREWKLYISDMALNNIRKLFTGQAVDVFELSLQGFDADEVCKKLTIKKGSVKVLKSRVRGRYLEEVKRLIRNFEEC